MMRFFIAKFMSAYIFDTSFLISLIHIDDTNHQRACDMISELDANQDRFFINDLILAETYTVFAYKTHYSMIATFDSFLETLPVQYI